MHINTYVWYQRKGTLSSYGSPYGLVILRVRASEGKMGKDMKERELLETQPHAEVWHANKILGVLNVRND